MSRERMLGAAALSGLALVAGWIGWGYERTRPHGVILVGSPTIYTRQRLVNDRLQEAEWLTKQLKVTEDKLLEFNWSDGSISRSLDSVTKIGGGISKAVEAPGDVSPSAARAAEAAAPGAALPAPTTLDRFEALSNFREAVRVRLMQTQLDDRHDILGNTVYRLSFDTSILAAPDSHSAAVVIVHLKHDPDSRAVEDEYHQMYLDWLHNSVSSELRNGVEQTLLALQSGDPVALSSKAWLPAFFEARTCDLIDKISSSLYGSDPRRCDREPGSAHESAEVKEARNAFANLIQTRLDGLYKDAKESTKKSNESYNAALRERLNYIEKHIDDFIASNPAKGKISKPYDRVSVEAALRGACGDKKNRPPYFPLLTTTEGAAIPSANFPCPPGDWEPSLDDVFRVYRDLYLKGDLLVGFGPPLIHEIVEAIKPLKKTSDVIEYIFSEKILSDGRLDGPVLDRVKLIEKYMGETYVGQRLRCFANDLYLWHIRGGETDVGHSIDKYVYVENAGKEHMRCALSIKQKKDGHSSVKADVSVANELFVYSLEPKGEMQRVKTSMASHRLLSAYAAAHSDGRAKTAMDLDIESARSEALQFDAIQNHALVIPIGEGRPQRSASAPSGALLDRDVWFGWAIAPRIGEGNRPSHIDGVRPLAAVISMPGWWHSVDAEFETCWVDPADLDALLNASNEAADARSSKSTSVASRDRAGGLPLSRFCSPERKRPHFERIRLPGSEKDISLKLGLELQKVPHLDSVQLSEQTLTVGQPGTILLRGGRLWRATEVYVGTMKAEQISVLPDMDGIAAHFNCVWPLGGDIDEGPQFVKRFPAMVVTSEGRDVSDAIIVVKPASTTKSGESTAPCPRRALGEPSTAAAAARGGSQTAASTTNP